MKKLLIAFFLLPLFAVAVAQDCALKKETDPITSQAKLTTGFVPFNTGGSQISLSLEVSSTEINLLFLLESPTPCFKDESTATVNFAGERTKVKLKNMGGANCQGIFQMMYKNTAVTAPYLERLSQKKIASIQFKLEAYDEKVINVNISASQQQQLMDMLVCIIKQGKTLIR